MMKRHRRATVSLAALALAVALGSAHAQSAQAPSMEEIADAVGVELPGGWEVTGVRVTASVNEGDAINPSVRQRFIATISPTEDLLAPIGERFGPFVVATPTVRDEEEREIHGSLAAPFTGGQWRFTIEIENDLSGQGMPEMAFGEPVVIVGSEKAAARMEQLAAVGSLVTEHERLRRDGLMKIARVRSDVASQIAAIEEASRATIEAARLAGEAALLAAEEEAAAARGTAAAKIEEAEAETAAIETRIAAKRVAAQRAEEEALAAAREKAAAMAEKADAEIAAIEARTAKRRETTRAEIEAIEAEAKASIEAARKRVADEVAKVEASGELQSRLAALTRDAETLAEIEKAEGVRARQVAATEVAKAEAAKAETAARSYTANALLAGLKAEGSAERYEALRQIADGGVPEQIAAAYDMIMAGKDDGLKNAVAEVAVTGNDAGLRRRGFRYILQNSDVLPVTLAWSKGTYTIPVPLDSDGRAKSSFEGGQIIESIIGANGINIQVTHNGKWRAECAISLRYVGNRKLQGNGQCESSSTSFPYDSGTYVASARLP